MNSFHNNNNKGWNRKESLSRGQAGTILLEVCLVTLIKALKMCLSLAQQSRPTNLFQENKMKEGGRRRFAGCAAPVTERLLGKYLLNVRLSFSVVLCCFVCKRKNWKQQRTPAQRQIPHEQLKWTPVRTWELPVKLFTWILHLPPRVYNGRSSGSWFWCSLGGSGTGI